jgi:hypothetical protein
VRTRRFSLLFTPEQFQFVPAPGEENPHVEVEGKADGRASAPADEGLEVPPPPEAVAPESFGRCLHLVREVFVLGEAADQGENGPQVPRGPAAYRQPSAGHQAAAMSSSISV